VGTVSNSAYLWVAELQTYLAATPSIAPGSYVVTLAGADDPTLGPIGYSVFDVAITNDGTATITGYLADNTPVSQTARLSADGYCPIYIPLYGYAGGLLTGWLTFTNDPTYDSLSDNSSLTWFNTADDTTGQYAGGFTNQLTALGSPYAARFQQQRGLRLPHAEWW
jgi:hypothetical protein